MHISVELTLNSLAVTIIVECRNNSFVDHTFEQLNTLDYNYTPLNNNCTPLTHNPIRPGE